jgi:hypothetical protein
MRNKFCALVIGAIFLVEPISIVFFDAPPAIAAHRTKKNGSFKGNRDKHQSGPQAGRREKKRGGKNWIQQLGKKLHGNAARRNSRVKGVR